MISLQTSILSEMQTLSAQQLQEVWLFVTFLKYKTMIDLTEETVTPTISPLQQQLLLQREKDMKENPDKQMTWDSLKQKLQERYSY